MADFSHKRLRDILEAELDFESPIDEDLINRIVANIFETASSVDGQGDQRFEASANGTPSIGLLIIDTIISGGFVRDDQYNTSYILVTSGPASGKGVSSRFIINDSDESAQSFNCGNNDLGQSLQAAGMVNNDTFHVMGHTHDGIDGEKIKVSDIDFNDATLVTAYTQSGKSQTRTGTSGPAGNGHFVVLPVPSVDYLITMSYKVSSTGTGGANIRKGAVIKVGSAGRGGHNDFDEGSLSLIVQDGDQIVAHNDGGGGTMFATFDIVTFQRIQ